MASYNLISGLFFILSQVAGIGRVFGIGEFLSVLMLELGAMSRCLTKLRPQKDAHLICNVIDPARKIGTR